MSDTQPQRPHSDTWYKNQLQEYAQKASIGLPTYKTVSEGLAHAPQFRSVVWVDGNCFTSLHTFPNRKMAEQEAAKLALIGIRDKVKNEGSARIFTDTVFCKSIISEYAVKMGMGPPTYTTQQTKALLPFFVSTLVLKEVAYVGDAARNKKEAEQVAARAAILSILDSESSTTMSEIVRSKYKFFDALKIGKGSFNIQNGNMPPELNTLENDSALLLANNNNKRKEVCDSASAAILEPLQPGQCPAIEPPPPQPAFEQPPVAQADIHQPIHELKRPRAETPSEAIDLPIVFVPSTEAQAPETSVSACARKRKRRKERKRQQAQPPPSVPVAIGSVPPQNPTPDCSTAQ